MIELRERAGRDVISSREASAPGEDTTATSGVNSETLALCKTGVMVVS